MLHLDDYRQVTRGTLECSSDLPVVAQTQHEPLHCSHTPSISHALSDKEQANEAQDQSH